MPHALQLQLQELQRRVRRMLVAYGACCTLGLVVIVTLACGLLDFTLRLQDHGVRAIVSAIWVACLGWSTWRFLGRGLTSRLGDVDLALKVEKALPALRDRLASSLEFLREREDDPLAGSPELRRQVIVQTTTDASSLDFSKLLRARPVRRAAWACGAVLLAAAATLLANPAAGAVALARLAAPWGSTSWPQANELTFASVVERLGTGETFEVEVVDARGAPLPDDARMHLRYRGPAEREVVETIPWINDALVLRKENVTRPFSYAVEGGDDRTLEWHELEIVEPPAIDDLQVSLRFPFFFACRCGGHAFSRTQRPGRSS
jgi:hypothetical protein